MEFSVIKYRMSLRDQGRYIDPIHQVSKLHISTKLFARYWKHNLVPAKVDSLIFEMTSAIAFGG